MKRRGPQQQRLRDEAATGRDSDIHETRDWRQAYMELESHFWVIGTVIRIGEQYMHRPAEDSKANGYSTYVGGVTCSAIRLRATTERRSAPRRLERGLIVRGNFDFALREPDLAGAARSRESADHTGGFNARADCNASRDRNLTGVPARSRSTAYRLGQSKLIDSSRRLDRGVQSDRQDVPCGDERLRPR